MKLMASTSSWCFRRRVHYPLSAAGPPGVVVHGHGHGHAPDRPLVGGWGDGESEVGVGCLEVVSAPWRASSRFDVAFSRWNGHLESCSSQLEFSGGCNPQINSLGSGQPEKVWGPAILMAARRHLGRPRGSVGWRCTSPILPQLGLVPLQSWGRAISGIALGQLFGPVALWPHGDGTRRNTTIYSAH